MLVLTIRRHLQRYGALLPAVVFALVLLLSQGLGLLHGIVHGPLIATTGAAASVAQVTGAVVEPDHDADNFFTRLLSGHSSQDGGSDCRLFDQSCHFDAMPGLPVLALPRVLLPFVLPVLPGLALARWHALFQARGPPSVR